MWDPDVFEDDRYSRLNGQEDPPVGLFFARMLVAIAALMAFAYWAYQQLEAAK